MTAMIWDKVYAALVGLGSCHKNIPIIYVFVIVFVSLHVDI